MPGSPRSVASSEISDTIPVLDPSTLSALDSFLTNKADEEHRFQELEQQASERLASLASDGGEEDKPMMSVDEYRRAFGEDWQLSQFWLAIHLPESSSYRMLAQMSKGSSRYTTEFAPIKSQ